MLVDVVRGGGFRHGGGGGDDRGVGVDWDGGLGGDVEGSSGEGRHRWCVIGCGLWAVEFLENGGVVGHGTVFAGRQLIEARFGALSADLSCVTGTAPAGCDGLVGCFFAVVGSG